MKKKLSPVLIFAGIVNFFLFFIKFYIGIRTNSQCIYTDSINNLMDTLSLCLALIGISFINKPATSRFRYGFGRMEDITSFVMSLIMTAAGLGFAYSSLGRMMTPVPVWYFTKYSVIIGATCLVKLILGIIFTLKYKKQKSAVLKTVMLDSFLDCGITAVTLISFTVSNSAGFVLDAILELAISIIIAVAGIRLIISSLAEIIGQHSEEIYGNTEKIIEEVCENTTYSVKEILVHSYGKNRVYVNIYMVSTEQNAENLYAVQNTIKSRLKSELGYASAIEWEAKS